MQYYSCSVVKTTLSYFSNHIRTVLSVSTQDIVRFLLLRVLLHGLTYFFLHFDLTSKAVKAGTAGEI